MSAVEDIKKLRNNSLRIKQFFEKTLPSWDSDSRIDKFGHGFNGDDRFSACNSVPIYFSSHSGVYGNSSCSSCLSLDSKIFKDHLIKYLNKNEKAIMYAIAESIDLEAKSLRTKAEEELKKQIDELSELDNI